MINIMVLDSNIPDTHPVVLDFIFRWNRLCELYETGRVPPHPVTQSKSQMFWGLPLVLEPRLETLPFEFYTADIMRNKVLEPIPNLFKLQVVNLLTNDERKIQGKKIPEINFFETMMRLKLFLQEADSLRVMGLLDDFCLRKNHDFFFGEDALWLQQIHRDRPQVATKVLLYQMKFYHKHYVNQGDTAVSRCIEATAGRIDEQRSIPADMRRVFRTESAKILVHEIAKTGKETHTQYGLSGRRHEQFRTIVPSHESMLRAMAQDSGEDKKLADELAREFVGEDLREDAAADSLFNEVFADEYVKNRRESLTMSDVDPIFSGERSVGDNFVTLRGSALFDREGSAMIRQELKNFLSQIPEDEGWQRRGLVL